MSGSGQKQRPATEWTPVLAAPETRFGSIRVYRPPPKGYPSCSGQPHRVLYCILRPGLRSMAHGTEENDNLTTIRSGILPSPNKKHVRVLLVDENQEDAERIVNALRASDMQIAAERVDSEDALVFALREFKPDVVLTEHALARLDYRTVLESV